ncbi:MAG TPA: M3 family oligoendopeptidase [Candidatus Paceibacterota bacterium]|nr:M3 family oligoendopeptidase [Candidatus Paceibacterota bacterium]
MKWNLNPLFKGDTDPQIAQKQEASLKASYNFINKWKIRKDYLNDPKVLAVALKEYETWVANFGTNDQVCYYFWLRSEQEKNNTKIKAGLNHAKDAAIKIENDIQFFTLNLSKVSLATQKKFLKAPELKPYQRFLERLFETARFVRTDAEEKILNHLSDTSYRRWVDLVESLLAEEERGGQNFPTLLADCAHQDKKKRDKAGQNVNQILRAWAPVAEQELNAVLEYKKSIDQIREAEEPETLRLVSDDIDKSSVEAMLATVEDNFSLAQRYYKLKAKILKQDKLTYFERGTPVGQIDKKWSFVEAEKLVSQQLTKLDPELGQIFASFIKNGQLDVLPKKGKSDGAFCAHYSSTLPTYILLNHTGQWRDVKTLAHEVGHGINNELTRKMSRPLYFGTPTSTAEVASTFFEDLVLSRLHEQSGQASLREKLADQEKLAMMMAKLDDEVSTIFRQVAAYRFEQELHRAFRKQGYLAKEKIGELWQKEMKKYLGSAVSFPRGSENWWVYWSHFRNFFYVYSYASGLLIAKALQTKVREKPKFIEEVKKFLGAGLSQSPKQIFLDLGLDISQPDFWQTGIDQFAELLQEAEKLYNNTYGRRK